MRLLGSAVTPSTERRLDYKRPILFVIAMLLALAASHEGQAQRGAMTLPRNLSDLASLSDRVIQGKVMSARVEPHPEYRNLQTLLITLQVEDVLKGDNIKTLTFRQFIWDMRDISDLAGYRVGDEVLLFLNRITPIGLTSPVGLEQGRFRVVRDARGQFVAINGNGNADLLKGIIESGSLNPAKLTANSRSEVATFKHGAISLRALKESTRLLLQSQTRIQ